MDLKSLWEAAKIVEAESITVPSAKKARGNTSISPKELQEAAPISRALGTSKKSTVHRMNHNNLEKCRRAFLRDCLTNLRSFIPKSTDCSKSTTLSLLLNSKDYIIVSLYLIYLFSVALMKSLQNDEENLKSSIRAACDKFNTLRKSILIIVGEENFFRSLDNSKKIKFKSSILFSGASCDEDQISNGEFDYEKSQKNISGDCSIVDRLNNREINLNCDRKKMKSEKCTSTREDRIENNTEKMSTFRPKTDRVPCHDFGDLDDYKSYIPCSVDGNCSSTVSVSSSFQTTNDAVSLNYELDHLYSFDHPQRPPNFQCDSLNDSGISSEYSTCGSCPGSSSSSSCSSHSSFNFSTVENNVNSKVNKTSFTDDANSADDFLNSSTSSEEHDKKAYDSLAKNPISRVLPKRQHSNSKNSSSKYCSPRWDSKLHLEFRSRRRDRLHSLNERVTQLYDKKCCFESHTSSFPFRKHASWALDSCSL